MQKDPQSITAAVHSDRITPSAPLPWQADHRRELLELVLLDREWECEAATRVRMRQMLRVLQAAAAGQPDELARPSEEAWAMLAEQLECYVGFRRLRQFEAGLRAYMRHGWPLAKDQTGIVRLAWQGAPGAR